MDLNTYLFLSKLTKVRFAMRLGIDRTYLHHILSGKHPASKKLAQRIEKATFGKVTVHEIESLYKMNKQKLKEMGIPEIPEDHRQLDMLKENS